ncbi:hypothetical protein ACI2KT_36025, partial [Ensifer adhaerens]|uniref:hypothetical protein n=1 Tax=Ensifer adhaerens TaxID=106592 RepID=UPI00384BA3A7
QSLDQTLIRKPYSEVAHFSVEKPAQFRAETNKPKVRNPLGNCVQIPLEQILLCAEVLPRKLN